MGQTRTAGRIRAESVHPLIAEVRGLHPYALSIFSLSVQLHLVGISKPLRDIGGGMLMRATVLPGWR
jgi:hypothetical protein